MTAKVSEVALMLRGGLGNQLFQYAAARHLSMHSPGAKLTVLSYGNSWGGNHPDIQSIMGVPIQYPNRMYRSRLPGIAVRESWKDRVSEFSAKIFGQVQSIEFIHQSDPFATCETYKSSKYVLDGFFQHPSWWMPVWHEVATSLLAAEPDGVQELRSERKVAIKLRRSDYLESGWELPDSYYRDALETLEIRNCEIVVTCEDDEYLGHFAHLLKDFGCEMVRPIAITGNPNVDDFWNLAAAENLVLANSSYCWWAGAVASIASPKTRVVYPTPWLPNHWSDAPMPDLGIEGWTSCQSGLPFKPIKK